MIAKGRLGLMRLFIVFAKALIISWALIFLEEYFDWHLLSEAGGNLVRAAL